MLKVLLIPALDDSNIELIKKSCSDMNLLKVNKEDLTQEMIDEADVIVGNPPRQFNLNRPTLKALLLNSAGNDQFLLSFFHGSVPLFYSKCKNSKFKYLDKIISLFLLTINPVSIRPGILQ